MITNQQLKQVIRDKYAWPGGYELFGICSDGGVLCCDCMRGEYKRTAWSRKHRATDGWCVEAVDHEGNLEEDLLCDHCNKVIYEAETD